MSSAPGLVLLHAFPLDSRLYDAVAADLLTGNTTFAPSFGGFGDAPMPREEPSLDVYANDIVRLMDARDIRTAVVAGSSMGGYVAMAMLRLHPDRVAGLVFANTRASADADAARENRLRMAREVEERNSSTQLLDEMLPKLLGATTWQRRPGVAEKIRGLVEQAPPPAVAWAQRAMAARTDSHDVLRKHTVPSVVLAGDEDQLIPLADAQATADALGDGRLVATPDAGHLIAIERPDIFVAAVRDVAAAAAAA